MNLVAASLFEIYKNLQIDNVNENGSPQPRIRQESGTLHQRIQQRVSDWR